MVRLWTLLVLLNTQIALSQGLNLDAFVRLPHTVNHNFSGKSSFYSSAVSAGVTLSYNQVFSDFGAFITDENLRGYYSYFGSPIFTRQLDDHWILCFNWFGEIANVHAVETRERQWIYTSGVSPVILKPMAWTTFAVALTAGAAYTQETVSVNGRLIINMSFPLRRKRNKQV